MAAQLHRSAASPAAFRRTRASTVPSSCRWLRSPLAGFPKGLIYVQNDELKAEPLRLCSPSLISDGISQISLNKALVLELSICTSRVGMKPFRLGAKMSTKCVNENFQVVELNSRSDRIKEFAQADEHVIPEKRGAKIHDFCLGIPFGGLLFSMGLLGYIFSRSTISLVLGVAPGLATLLLGTISLKFWRSGRSSFPLIFAQAAISAVLAWKYSHAYFLTNRLLPWGFYASLSTAMACFYIYVMLAGGNPPPKKLVAVPPP